MKHKLLLLTFLFLAFIGTASAQIEKGKYYVGGSLNLNYDGKGTTDYYTFQTGYTQYTNNQITTFQISPEFGYFISNKWSIGIRPSYSYTTGTETSVFTSFNDATHNYVYVDKYNLNIIGLGINLRYYWMFTDKVGLFPQFGVNTSNNLQDLSYGTISVTASPNVVFFPTPKLGINLSFGNLAYSLDYQTQTSNFNLGINNSITFGLNYYFGKK